MSLRAVVLLAVLAGCAEGPPPRPEAAACEREAEESPAVREIRMKGLGNDSYRSANQERLAQARQQALLTCLRLKGLAAPGGVQAHDPDS